MEGFTESVLERDEIIKSILRMILSYCWEFYKHTDVYILNRWKSLQFFPFYEVNQINCCQRTKDTKEEKSLRLENLWLPFIIIEIIFKIVVL